MSMFLVSLGIIVAAIACSTWLALRGADQPATARGPSRRAQPARLPAAPTVAPVETQRPEVSRRVASRSVAAPARPGERTRREPDVFVYVPAGRLRAGLALSVLATFIGVLLALAVAGGIVFVAEGLRNSVR